MKFALNGFSQKIILIAIMTLNIAGFVLADSESFFNANAEYAADSLWDDVWTLPDEMYDGMGRIYLREDNFLALLLAGGGSVAMHASGADDKIAENFEDKMILSDFTDKSLDFVGGPGQHFIFSGIWYLASAYNGDELNQQRAWTMIKALSYTGFSTFSLKLVRNNDTPNGKDLAWPSGHTSSSFCVASVLDEFYGPEVGIPAYMLAGFVGYRMMESGDHWGSDVLFGAVIGYITGHTVAGEEKDKWQIAGYDIMPYVAPNNIDSSTMGVSFVKQF